MSDGFKDINHIPVESNVALYYRVGLCGATVTEPLDGPQTVPRHWVAVDHSTWQYYSEQTDEDVCDACAILHMAAE